MIETLTPPAKTAAIHPGAKAAAGAAGGVDFAALFGNAGAGVEDGVDPTNDIMPNTIASVATLPDETSAGPVPPVDPAAVTPAFGDATIPGSVTTGAETPPPPADPATLLTTAEMASPPETGAVPDAPEVAATAPTLKPPAIRPHGPVTVDDDSGFRLPTLPPGFIAQKAPKLPLGSDEPTPDDQQQESAEDAAAGAVPPPLLQACAVPAPQAAPAPAVAAALISDVPVARRGTASPKVAEKIELTAKSGDATASDDAGTVPTTDITPASSTTRPTGAHTTTADPATALQSLPVAPSAPVGTPAPQAVTSAASTVAAQQSVALDDLMVAGAGDSAWLDRVAGDISTLAKGDAREAHMKINPRVLGDMSIRLDMDGQRTRVHFTVDTPQAQAMIADAAPKLTSLVQANGLKLDGTTVDLNQQRQDSQSGQAQQRQQADTASALTRGRSEVARLVERTRIATRTDRFA